MSSTHTRINRLQQRLQSINSIAEKLKRIDQRFVWYRLTAFLGAWVLAILARFLFPGNIWVGVLVGMVLVFLLVVFFHRRLDQQRLKYQNAQEWLQTQLARANLNWDLIPEIPAKTANPDHPFMNDLNLVGERSLLSLINTCATQGAQNLLHSWFLEPNLKIEVLEKRQNLVKELTELSGFRTRLMLSGLAEKSASQQVDQTLVGPVVRSGRVELCSAGSEFIGWLAALLAIQPDFVSGRLLFPISQLRIHLSGRLSTQQRPATPGKKPCLSGDLPRQAWQSFGRVIIRR